MNKITTYLALFILAPVFAGAQRYIVVRESWLKSQPLEDISQRYIPIADTLLGKSKLLDTAVYMLQTNDEIRLGKYLKKQEKSGIVSGELYLALALQNVVAEQYAEADAYLSRIANDSYSFLKKLIQIDLSYEIALANRKAKFNKCLKAMQELQDADPTLAYLPKLLAIRLEKLRYNE